MVKSVYNINPFTDYGFKKLFGEESSKEILLDFINAVLEGRSEKIVDIEYSRQEHPAKVKEMRNAVFDIHCTTEKGEFIIVEMQKVKQENFKDRILYYSTVPIQTQAKKGDWNYNFKGVYCICLLNFRLDSCEGGNSRYLYEIALMDRETNAVFSHKLKFFYLEIPNFNKKVSDLGTKLKNGYFYCNYSHRCFQGQK